MALEKPHRLPAQREPLLRLRPRAASSGNDRTVCASSPASNNGTGAHFSAACHGPVTTVLETVARLRLELPMRLGLVVFGGLGGVIPGGSQLVENSKFLPGDG